MAFILSIDTSISTASVSLAIDGIVLAKEINTDTRSHGSFIQNAISNLFLDSKKNLNELDAIAVVNGPGSYTGLRVGLATAKGLCFTINKPLVLLNTLEILAQTVINNLKSVVDKKELDDYLFCPMIDARRMEVFTAIYDSEMKVIESPNAKVLNAQSFDSLLDTRKMVFTGNGHQKLKGILTHSNAFFIDIMDITHTISFMAEKFICENKVSDLAYCEPFYLKDVYFAEKSKI